MNTQDEINRLDFALRSKWSHIIPEQPVDNKRGHAYVDDVKTNPCPHCNGTGKVRDQIELGKTMRKMRIKCSVSLRTVAKRMGFSASYISDLELGRRHWTPKMLVEYEKASLNVPY